MGPETEVTNSNTEQQKKEDQEKEGINLKMLADTAKGFLGKILPLPSTQAHTAAGSDSESKPADSPAGSMEAGPLGDSKLTADLLEDSPYQFHGGKALVDRQTRKLEAEGTLPHTELDGAALDKAREAHEKETRKKIVETHQLIPLERGWGPYQALEKMHPDWSAKKTVAEAQRIRDLNLHGRTYFDEGERLLTLSQSEIDKLVAAEMKKFDQEQTEVKQENKETSAQEIKSEETKSPPETDNKTSERKQAEAKIRAAIVQESKLIPLQPGWGPYQALEKMYPELPKQKVLEQAVQIKELNGGGPFKINQELLTRSPEAIDKLVQEQMKLYDEQQAKLDKERRLEEEAKAAAEKAAPAEAPTAPAASPPQAEVKPDAPPAAASPTPAEVKPEASPAPAASPAPVEVKPEAPPAPAASPTPAEVKPEAPPAPAASPTPVEVKPEAPPAAAAPPSPAEVKPERSTNQYEDASEDG